ncbi:hypothetical protein [Rhodopseudomonas palustris]|uniref:hypothetical protein n=1 Tax=Rhodopseudomonas palustris TaxID=1076 RepID=UPI0021F251CC|nr:hypothetical protein [Rhodopseudomonas palustris]UYO53755.1 hypothetical protein KQX61_24835 [Rhodopseudomonas palustris]
MLLASPITRELFLSWVGGNYSPSPKKIDPQDAREAVRFGEICLLWNSEPTAADFSVRSTPVIAVPDQQIREFFSFVATYVLSYQPFTTFFRVVRASSIPELLHLRPRTNIGEKCIGAIIAETRMQLGSPRRELSEIPIQSCLATVSYAAVVALSRGLSMASLEETLNNWIRARISLTDERLPVPLEKIIQFWMIFGYALEPVQSNVSMPPKFRELAELVAGVIFQKSDASPRNWRALTIDLPRSRVALPRLKGSREERIRAMDEITTEVVTERIDSDFAEILLGYCAAMAGGGSLRYFPLLQEVEQRFPLATMWFGLFCSFQNESDAPTVAECLGRRVLKHIEGQEDIFAVPTADISIDEFMGLAAGSKLSRVRTEFQSAISIELFPTIVSSYRFGARSVPKNVGETEPLVSVGDWREMRHHASRLLQILSAIDFPEKPTRVGQERPGSARRVKKGDRRE